MVEHGEPTGETVAYVILKALLIESGGKLTVSLASIQKAEDYDLVLRNVGETLREVEIVER